MDKEEILEHGMALVKKISKWFFLFREYCNYYIFSTGLIFTGLAILLINQFNVGFYSFMILGTIFIGLHFFYNRFWAFSLMGSLLISLGLYIVLLLSHLLPDGGEVAVVMFVGIGFLVFYGIEGRWSQYWPLISGIPVTIFGLLIYLHQTGQYHFGLIPLIYKFWPILIVLFGICSLFSKDIKKRIFLLKSKMPVKK